MKGEWTAAECSKQEKGRQILLCLCLFVNAVTTVRYIGCNRVVMCCSTECAASNGTFVCQGDSDRQCEGDSDRQPRLRGDSF